MPGDSWIGNAILAFRTGDAPERLVSEVARLLAAEGIRPWRVSSALHVFHPSITGIHITWVRDEGASLVTRGHGVLSSTVWRGSPIEAVTSGPDELRERLGPGLPPSSFPQLRELAAAGATDYVVFGLDAPESITSSADTYWRRHWISFTSDDPDGFADSHLARFRDLLPAFAARLALEVSRVSALSLLRSYLGANATRRIISGAWHRGTGEPIRAVVWFCDMRGFTTFSDTRPAREVVSTLDAYFDAVASPVAECGGEVLKFIGDAVLAIFPFVDGGPEDACQRAMRAARDARKNLASLNVERAKNGDPPLGLGIAMHTGEVMYGNIGAQDRLDFTVIGAPVNEVCRVEPLTRTLAADVLLTSAFVRDAGLRDAPSLGKHALKGVGESLEVFGLPGEA